MLSLVHLDVFGLGFVRYVFLDSCLEDEFGAIFGVRDVQSPMLGHPNDIPDPSVVNMLPIVIKYGNSRKIMHRPAMR